jgi:mycofactocin biosynthesis protein MftB
VSTDHAPSGAFDPDRAYRCSPRVALRPEPFGALVYHFGSRRLSFLKTPQLVAVVSGLEQHDSIEERS